MEMLNERVMLDHWSCGTKCVRVLFVLSPVRLLALSECAKIEASAEMLPPRFGLVLTVRNHPTAAPFVPYAYL